METIWKFELGITDEQTVHIPTGAGLLCVQMQHGVLCLWAMVDPDRPTQPVLIRILGTGHEIKSCPGEHLGTVQQQGGALIWHVFNGGLDDQHS